MGGGKFGKPVRGTLIVDRGGTPMFETTPPIEKYRIENPAAYADLEQGRHPATAQVSTSRDLARVTSVRNYRAGTASA